MVLEINSSRRQQSNRILGILANISQRQLPNLPEELVSLLEQCHCVTAGKFSSHNFQNATFVDNRGNRFTLSLNDDKHCYTVDVTRQGNPAGNYSLHVNNQIVRRLETAVTSKLHESEGLHAGDHKKKVIS